MNILFFLSPKQDLMYVYDDFTLRQTLEKWENNRYASIPVLNRQGKYVGTLTEGDILWGLKKFHGLDLEAAEDIPISEFAHKRDYKAVTVTTSMDELVEAARIDGASPMRFFCDIVFPLSKTNLAALFVITFIYGWNQYLWPLLIITDVDLGTTVAGIKGMIATGEGTTEWNSVMAAMLLTLIPPVVIVLVMQRAFVRGLVDSEK